MNDQAKGATAEINTEADDKVVAALDALKAAYIAGEIEALAFASVRADGNTGPAGWAGKQSQWGATLGYQIHLLGFRYDAMICAAGIPNAPLMSEVDEPEIYERTKPDDGLNS